MTSGLPRDQSASNTFSTSLYSFEAFLHRWQDQQDELLKAITTALARTRPSEAEAKELVSRGLGHFEEYYEHKSRAAHESVFQLFSPTWTCSFECAFLWIAGFRPGVLLELVLDSIHNLSPRQTRAIESLKRETKVEEKQIAEKLARIQENTAAPPMIHSLKDGSKWFPEEKPFRPSRNDALDRLQVVLEEVVASADTLRVTTAASVAKILTPLQGLRFLEAFIRLEQGMRTVRMNRTR